MFCKICMYVFVYTFSNAVVQLKIVHMPQLNFQHQVLTSEKLAAVYHLKYDYLFYTFLVK